MSDQTTCGHCGFEFFSPWQGAKVVSKNAMRSASMTVGTIYATTCPGGNCGREVLEYQSATNTADGMPERVPVFPNQGGLTLQVVITLVVEIEDLRRRNRGDGAMTDSEREEFRARPSTVEKAKSLILATAASAAGGTAANVISGLLS